MGVINDTTNKITNETALNEQLEGTGTIIRLKPKKIITKNSKEGRIHYSDEIVNP